MPIRTARDEDQAVVARSSFSENVHTPRHHALPQAMVKRFLRSAFAHRASAARRNTASDATRLKVQQKADERRRQGFIGPTMASHAELAYTGIVDALAALDPEFMLRRETGQRQPREEAVAPRGDAAAIAAGGKRRAMYPFPTSVEFPRGARCPERLTQSAHPARR
jgi:hypothetical protein